MKIEKINDNKIKITLSAKDLEERNLDFQALKYNSPATQSLFWDMIKKAETEHGFTAANCQLFIEASSVVDGDFIVTITKMSDIINLHTSSYARKNSSPSLRVRKKTHSHITSCIVRFSSFDNLSDAITVSTLPDNLSSVVYEYNNYYYLLLKPENLEIAALAKAVLLLGEFGEIIYDINYTEGLLFEYGNKIIAKDAVKNLKR